MAAINDLLRQVPDATLRSRLEQEFSRLAKNKKFGLVFEEHIPECTPLYGITVKRGSTVARKAGRINDVFTVVKLIGDAAHCRNKATGETVSIPLTELVSVAQFGEPIFPMLQPIASVENAPDSDLWHTLIEADNYHALQLLEYLYPKQVDCIYIDPPYNTGAKDWKYNNDYVDSSDSWRHSKWLSMMQKRLRIAKRILNPENSVLIVAIDDNELFSLGILLDELFPGTERQLINITINPKGKARDGRLSQVDEYLIIVYLGEAKAQEQIVDTMAKEIRWPYLRRSDVESARGTKKGGVRQFYPIYVNVNTEKVVSVGDPLAPDQDINNVPHITDTVPVFPIREDGKHMNWGLTSPSFEYALNNGFIKVTKSSNLFQPYNFTYVTLPSIRKIEDGLYQVIGHREDGSKIVVVPNGKPQKSTTAWSKNLYDANAYGSQLIGNVLPNIKFPFPKSLYSVIDVLRVFVGSNPNALIIDFFAGSGTTLHAANLLNAEDGGHRQCILVTNNEVSVDEARDLQREGYQPGDPEWERHGICRAVTWPRTKYSILGKRADDTALTGEYFTNQTVTKEVPRTFRQLRFDSEAMDLNAKKDIVALLGGKLPQNLVTRQGAFIVSEKHTISVLFDPTAAEAWVAELEEQDHITEFYIVVKETAVFNRLKERINELLGTVTVTEQIKRPINEGFPANAEYFKLGFLDKNSVSLGRQFHEILPLLWLKSGAIDRRPEISADEEPEMLILPQNGFAILVDETKYAEFAKKLSEEDNIKVVYFVTNSEEAFREMTAVVKANNTYQLYRDYIDNFVLGSRRDS
ncbi:MAG: DNA methyltransferase [Desulfitobacterium hafniense]|nr:DNA methyltransferase [Desulfitobacterium hafniense]